MDYLDRPSAAAALRVSLVFDRGAARARYVVTEVGIGEREMGALEIIRSTASTIAGQIAHAPFGVLAVVAVWCLYGRSRSEGAAAVSRSS